MRAIFAPLLLLALALSISPMATAVTPAAPALPGVTVISVADWGGSPADPSRARRHSITHITLHHQGEPFPQGKDPVAYLRTLQTWSRTTKHWLDIPYHYIIDLDGKIYQGRQLEYAGDTNTEYDPVGHALIEVVGNFEEVQPNQRQLDAVADLMAALARTYHVPLDAIAGHCGFTDAGYFCRIFRQHVGMSPRTYARRLRCE